MTKADVHIQVNDSLRIRKNVLLTAIDVTHLLKDYQEYLIIKKRKEKLINNFHSLMEQIKKFGEKVYKTEFGVLSSEYSVSKQKVESGKTKEEERLEAELRSIERKLKSL